MIYTLEMENMIFGLRSLGVVAADNLITYTFPSFEGRTILLTEAAT